METNTPFIADQPSDQIVYRSRYSIVLLLILLASLLLLVYAALIDPIALIGIIIAVPIIIMVLGFQYVINGNNLEFRTWGIQSGSVPIDSITKVERSYLVLSSNAGSFKRLYITLKRGSKYPFILISPRHESEFLIHLKRINPLIEINVENKTGKFRFWDWDL